MTIDWSPLEASNPWVLAPEQRETLRAAESLIRSGADAKRYYAEVEEMKRRIARGRGLPDKLEILGVTLNVAGTVPDSDPEVFANRLIIIARIVQERTNG